jgi:EpsI family protein
VALELGIRSQLAGDPHFGVAGLEVAQTAPSTGADTEFWGLTFLAAVMASWWLGYVIEIRSLQQLSMTAAITGITWALLGPRVTWLLAFPLLYLFLTVSVWGMFSEPMQEATAWLSAHAVRMLGVPLYREGPYLWIPEGSFLVDQTCSGLRYLMAGLSVGALYAYLSFDDLWRRGLFLGVTMVWALMVNVVRVTMVIYAGHLTDMQHPWVHEHINMGWVVFGVGLLVLFTIGNLIHRMPPFLRFSPIAKPVRARTGTPAAQVAAGLAAIALVTVAPAGAQWLEDRAAATSTRGTPPALPEVVGWDGPRLPPAKWQPHFPGADAEESAVYVSGQGAVYLYLGWYAYERADAKLLFFANRLFDPRRWLVSSDTVHRIDLNGAAFPVREQVLKEAGGFGTRVLWSWYRIDEQATASAWHAKLLGLRGVLRGRPEALVIALAADAQPDTVARNLLHQYLIAAEEQRR